MTTSDPEPEIQFAHSEPLTIGVEEEFLLVDADDPTRVAARADALLDGDWRTIASPGGWLKAELLRCSIELATAPSANLAQVDVDLRALRDAVVERADAAGARAIAIGMHPDLVVDDELVTPTQSHEAIAELHRRVGTLADQSTHGIHVHVGMPDLDSAIHVTGALAGCAPLLLALTVNSPIARCARAPWRSARADVLRRMLWAGPTPRFDDPADYRAVHRLHQLENRGEQRFLWEVAPVPALGTVEVRTADVSPDPRTTMAVAALVQAIAALVLEEGPGAVPRASDSIERHNRWSAMEFGPRARFLVAGRDAPVDAAVLVGELLDRLAPITDQLGTGRWLAPVEELLRRPHADVVVDAFEQGGVAGALESCALRNGALDHAGT